MNPVDELEAFQAIYDQSQEPHKERLQYIAKRFGTTILHVERRLRLAKLAPPILEALRSGFITLEMARAFGATEDCQKQMAIFDQYEFDGRDNFWKPSAENIKGSIKKGAIPSSEPCALYIGQQAYEKAGGKLEIDLFAAEGSASWLNPELAQDLATKSMQVIAADIQKKEGYAEIIVCPATGISWQLVDHLNQFQPRGKVVFTNKQKTTFDVLTAKRKEIDGHFEAIDEYEVQDDCENGERPVNPELEAKYDRGLELDRVIEQLEEEATQLPAHLQDTSKFIRVLKLSEHGQPVLSDSWYSATKVTYDGKPLDSTSNSSSHVDPKKKALQDAGLSQGLADELSIQRRDILAAELIAKPRLAEIYGQFVLVDGHIQKMRSSCPYHASSLDIGQLHEPCYVGNDKEYMIETAAQDALAEAEKALDWSWCGRGEDGRHDGDFRPNEIERFSQFCELTDKARQAWFAWAVVTSLKATEAVSRKDIIHDRLGTMLKINVAKWWTPDAINYWPRLSAATIESQLGEAGAIVDDADNIKLKKGEWVKTAADVCAGKEVDKPAFQTGKQVVSWSPLAMRFNDISSPERSPADG